jgi:hypothetical protein
MAKMKYSIAVCVFLVVGLFAGRSHACEMVSLRQGLPREGVTLGIGLVIGHGTAVHPAATVDNAPSLRVRINTVVSGNIASGETEIVPLYYGPDCKTAPTARDT